jgi:hypothetical protein
MAAHRERVMEELVKTFGYLCLAVAAYFGWLKARDGRD